jgi:hypothetical protein
LLQILPYICLMLSSFWGQGMHSCGSCPYVFQSDVMQSWTISCFACIFGRRCRIGCSGKTECLTCCSS